MKTLRVHTDGGARGNPGPAGIGVVITDSGGKELFKQGKYIGVATNNQAEYRAVVWALQVAQDLGADELEFFLDSQLVVEQLNQKYKIKNPELGKLFVEVWNLRQQFRRVAFSHVRREQNTLADWLVNQAIDAATA